MISRIRTRLPLAGALILATILPARAQDGPRISLSLSGAVRIALAPDGNAQVQLAARSVEQAEAFSSQQRAALLPNFSGSITEQSRTTNLDAMGIAFEVPVPGFERPGFVGPFETFDARARVTQNLMDWSAIERYRASKATVGEAQLMSENTRSEVAARAARGYASAIQARARVDAAEADVVLAQSLLELAESQRTAGTGTAIEVTRARFQLADQRQALLSARNESRRADLALLRVLDLDLDTDLSLESDLTTLVEGGPDLEDPVRTALERRPDLLAQDARTGAARQRYDAVRAERWPALQGFADYGSLGSSPGDSVPTRAIGVDLRVPIFDGGRRSAREAEARSLLDSEAIRTEEIRQDIELEVRLAATELETAEALLGVSEEGLSLAREELERAERRYAAGITTNVEVTDAQSRLARARESQILARTRLLVARIEMARATGTIETMIAGL